jgi:diaminopimelate epimerase
MHQPTEQTGLVFQKGEALGNDYLVVDVADLRAPWTPQLAIALCDRHRGAGSDGVIFVDVAAPEISIRILNPDGSEAEKSGNGLRILAAYLHRRGIVRGDEFGVRLVKDSVTMRVEERLRGGALMVRVDIGRADFRGAAVGFRPRAEETLGFALPLGDGAVAEVNTVSLSNPHCVVFVDALERDDFLRRAPRLCTHDAFAEGTNVQFARVAGPHELEAWIWERGAGETLASGSSASAVAAAAVRRGFAQPGTFTVRMVGGDVQVGVAPNYDIVLRGPARMVYEGRIWLPSGL